MYYEIGNLIGMFNVVCSTSPSKAEDPGGVFVKVDGLHCPVTPPIQQTQSDSASSSLEPHTTDAITMTVSFNCLQEWWDNNVHCLHRPTLMSAYARYSRNQLQYYAVL